MPFFTRVPGARRPWLLQVGPLAHSESQFGQSSMRPAVTCIMLRRRGILPRTIDLYPGREYGQNAARNFLRTVVQGDVAISIPDFHGAPRMKMSLAAAAAVICCVGLLAISSLSAQRPASPSAPRN